MKIKVLYNEHTKKYRIAYRQKWYRPWKFAMRIIMTQNISQVGMAKYVENSLEIAEFDAIGEAEAFITKYVAPHSEWYDPRDDDWTVEAEVEIPGTTKYNVPTVEANV